MIAEDRSLFLVIVSRLWHCRPMGRISVPKRTTDHLDSAFAKLPSDSYRNLLRWIVDMTYDPGAISIEAIIMKSCFDEGKHTSVSMLHLLIHRNYVVVDHL